MSRDELKEECSVMALYVSRVQKGFRGQMEVNLGLQKQCNSST